MTRFFGKKYYLIDIVEFIEERLLRWRFFFKNTI